jgi:SAM-dependent methyltransferase
MLDRHELRKISQTTLAHYDDTADAFWEGTRDHDVSQNVDALLSQLGTGLFRILDLGCGPGRDLRTFRDLGHEAVGLDGAARFVEMARHHTGCEVWHQDFLALDLPEAHFDGVFANASLFHVPAQELPRVLGELQATLRARGILFTSNPHGRNQEGWHDRRYGTYLDIAAWRAVVSSAGFVELEHYYRPAGLPRPRQPWLAMLWRKA